MTCPLCLLVKQTQLPASDSFHLAGDEAAIKSYVYGVFAGRGPMVAQLCPRHDVEVQQSFEQMQTVLSKGTSGGPS